LIDFGWGFVGMEIVLGEVKFENIVEVKALFSFFYVEFCQKYITIPPLFIPLNKYIKRNKSSNKV
jgi:hypothetical protein